MTSDPAFLLHLRGLILLQISTSTATTFRQEEEEESPAGILILAAVNRGILGKGREGKRHRSPNITAGEPPHASRHPRGYKDERTVSSLSVLPLGPSSPFLQHRECPGSPRCCPLCIYLSAHLQNRPPWPPVLEVLSSPHALVQGVQQKPS